MRFKLFEEFKTEKSYTPEAEKLLEQIKSFFGIKLTEDIFYEIVNWGEIIREELQNIFYRISNLNIKEETIFIVLINAIYPEVRESEKFKDIYWKQVKNWHEKLKTTDDPEVNTSEFQDKLQKLKEIHLRRRFSNLKDLIVNNPEWASDYETRKDSIKYNL